MTRVRTRTLVLVLDPEHWKALEREAQENERDPFQQARWVLVQHLRARSGPAAEPEPAEVA